MTDLGGFGFTGQVSDSFCEEKNAVSCPGQQPIYNSKTQAGRRALSTISALCVSRANSNPPLSLAATETDPHLLSACITHPSSQPPSTPVHLTYYIQLPHPSHCATPLCTKTLCCTLHCSAESH